MRTDRLRAAYEIEFRYTLFPLHPDTPDEGLTLEQLFTGRSLDIEAMQAKLVGLMAKEGLPYGKRTMTYNDIVDADWQRCRNLGISAVPTFVVGNQGIVGAQPYEALESLVVEGGAVER